MHQAAAPLAQRLQVAVAGIVRGIIDHAQCRRARRPAPETIDCSWRAGPLGVRPLRRQKAAQCRSLEQHRPGGVDRLQPFGLPTAHRILVNAQPVAGFLHRIGAVQFDQPVIGALARHGLRPLRPGTNDCGTVDQRTDRFRRDQGAPPQLARLQLALIDQ